MSKRAAPQKTKRTISKYAAFSSINGRHPYRQAVPDGYVNYKARYRPGGTVFYFNFRLAKEMGLLRKNHPEKLNRELRTVILQTFSLQIINEYDLLNDIRIPPRSIRPYTYMATRYLQLQHPDKRGLTSGDGRGIWNGYYRSKKGIWDICSTGTGGTCLSPATAIHGKFFKTGDPTVSYGCGRADLLDGVCQAVMSEIFHYNDVPTERVLAIIDYGDGSSVNVRVGKNLLRPAHFFRLIKQENYGELRGICDYYIKRQVDNGEWKISLRSKQRYQKMLEYISRDFARVAAHFESEYIFCWLDWDGDNILTDGGIIDYGSVRQFGLFHHEYRYDDVDKWSTTILEQKHKARYIVQTFVQIADFVTRGKKKKLSSFKKHPILKKFDAEYEMSRIRFLLYRMGMEYGQIKKLVNNSEGLREAKRFDKVFSYFEQAKAKRGRYKVEDGITWDAVFCLRDILRELPQLYLANVRHVDARSFMEILKSNYASRSDSKITDARRKKIEEFQAGYLKLVQRAAALSRKKPDTILRKMANRSALINHYDRVTGDSIIHIAHKMIRGRNRLGSEALHRMFVNFVNGQILKPEYFHHGHVPHRPIRNPKSRRLLKSMMRIVRSHREGI